MKASRIIIKNIIRHSLLYPRTLAFIIHPKAWSNKNKNDLLIKIFFYILDSSFLRHFFREQG